jgi:hypothetical protein
MRPHGPIATRHIYERMTSLEVGETFTLAPKDWPMATPPTVTIGMKHVETFNAASHPSIERSHPLDIFCDCAQMRYVDLFVWRVAVG